MIVGAEKLRAFHADGPITKSRAFGGAGNNTNVVWHDLILQKAPRSPGQGTVNCCSFAKLTALPVVAAQNPLPVINGCRGKVDSMDQIPRKGGRRTDLGGPPRPSWPNR